MIPPVKTGFVALPQTHSLKTQNKVFSKEHPSAPFPPGKKLQNFHYPLG
jgi:hypothetical protein